MQNITKHYRVEVKINRKKQKFIVDTGSRVTFMPCNKILHNTKDIFPLKGKHQDVNKKENRFLGKTSGNTE